MIPAALDGLPGLSVDGDGRCTIDLDAWRRKRDSFALAIEGALRSDELTHFEPSPQACRCFRPFVAQLESRKLRFAKVQVAGPATVRWAARVSTGEPASEVAELDQQIFQLLLARSLALVKAVRTAGATPILFLDEPGLFALRREGARHRVVLQELELLIAAAQRAGALVGLHCCSNTDWAAVLELGLDIVSIDARLSLDAVLEDRAAWLAFRSSGAALALGVVPTDLGASYVLAELVDSIEASLRATTPKGVGFESQLSRLILTPACGLGTRSVIDAERIVGEVVEAQRRLKVVAAEAATRTSVG